VTKKALLIGNSDGIGLAATKELLKLGWQVTGISRSESSIKDEAYEHAVAQVSNDDYLEKLESVVRENEVIDLCVYFVGIGELLNFEDMSAEVDVVDVNLLGMIKTASRVIPMMLRRGQGHFIGLSSLADDMLSPEAPSYHASKAGFSNYLEGLALALKSKGVHVTNLRFGFVDTKMAKGDFKPFMMSAGKAAWHLLKCVEKKPMRYTAPWVVIPLIKFRKWVLNMSVLFG